MPRVRDTTRTWLVASQSIYNHDDGGDRQQRWYRAGRVTANLVFVDGSAKFDVPVPEGIVQTTPDYTFLPSPTWLEQFGVPSD